MKKYISIFAALLLAACGEAFAPEDAISPKQYVMVKGLL